MVKILTIFLHYVYLFSLNMCHKSTKNRTGPLRVILVPHQITMMIHDDCIHINGNVSTVELTLLEV